MHHSCPLVPRIASLALAVGLVLSGSGACGRLNFEPVANTSDDGGSGDELDADLTPLFDAGLDDAAPATDATPTIAAMRFVASTSCTGPDNVLDVPAPGIPVGNVVLVQVMRRTLIGSIDVQDSRGNVYTEVERVGGEGTTVFLMQGTIAAALAPGDTIAVTESEPTASAVVITQLINGDPNVFSSQTAKADDPDISIGFTATSPGIVFCAGGIRAGDVVLTDNWNVLANLKDDCGGNGELSTFSYWIPTGQDGINSCDASLVLPVGFTQWAGLVRSYAEAP